MSKISPELLSLEYAKKRVQEVLDKMGGKDFHLIVTEDNLEKKDYGYIFQVSTQQYEDTGDVLFLPTGGGPLVYDAENEVISFLGTAERREVAIREYDKTRKPPP